MPRTADKVVFFFAPVISTICAFTALSVIPFGPMVQHLRARRRRCRSPTCRSAVLLVLACSSMGIYGIVLGGWASGSTYPLLGGLRSSAQMISYEVAMGLSIVAVFMTAGTMSTCGIVAAQAGGDRQLRHLRLATSTAPGWYAILLHPELRHLLHLRGRRDQPGAVRPARGGVASWSAAYIPSTRSLKFALFLLAEYVDMVTVSALCTTLFLGGWRAPWPITAFWAGANAGWWPLLWFIIKVLLLLFVFVWLRGTLPRLRYDQFMRFGWKVLLPINLVWILVAGRHQDRCRSEIDGRHAGG